MLWEIFFSDKNAESRPDSVQAVIEWFAGILAKIFDFIGKEEGWIAAE